MLLSTIFDRVVDQPLPATVATARDCQPQKWPATCQHGTFTQSSKSQFPLHPGFNDEHQRKCTEPYAISNRLIIMGPTAVEPQPTD